MSDVVFDAEQTRRDFPLTKKVIYMNNGAIAPTPLSTVKATTDYMIRCADEGPDTSQTAEYTTSMLNELRTRISHLINCDRDEVVLVQSTTEGLNMVANGIEWKRGDSIVVRGGRHEHYANYFPWLSVSQRKGVALKELAVDENGFFDLGELEKNARGARLIAMSHALYNTGAIMPLEQVGRIARENNALFCVDAAQSAGAIEVDVKKIGCDFMAFPGFKWLCGPTGIGIFYCSKKASEMISPPSIGGESATLEGDVLAHLEMPARLQAGFRNYPGAAGLESSMRYVLRTRIDSIRRRNTKIANAIREGVSKIQGMKMYGPDDERMRTSIVTFMPPSDSSELVKKLEQNGTVFAARDVGGGRKAVRAAPHFFNTEEEAEAAVKLVKSLL